MIIFNTDLDNTLIYSYKKDIGKSKLNVEIYQEREISFITKKTFKLLKQVQEEMIIVPTTTRTIEQYKRINLGIGNFKYALVCNGGILLVDGERDEDWYEESLDLIEESRAEINKSLLLLENEKRRTFEVRFIEKLFVFTKCEEAETVVNILKTKLDTKLVDVFNNKEKVYVVPKKLSKGYAVNRLRDRLKPRYVISAGDSEFDVSMVLNADKGIVPYGFKKKYDISEGIVEMDDKKIFSESLLEECIKVKEDLFSEILQK